MTKIETEMTGQQIYPQYDALWHLVTMGVLTPDHGPNGWTLPTPDKPTRVAVIDTSVAADHPNLVGVINRELSLDLFSARLGSFPFLPSDQTRISQLMLNWGTNIADGLPHSVRLLAEFVDRLATGEPKFWAGIQPSILPEFSNHGTSIAGIVGARPCIANHTIDTGEVSDMALPYTGVDPSCEIVQISTNFDPDPESLILAFLYADLIDADVVLFPRNIADPTRIVPELSDIEVDGMVLANAVQQIAPDAAKSEMWSELTQLIENISHVRPIVCAAGNANEDNAIYPANLASDHNGIISVGAANAKGALASYSSSGNITVMAPSNDAEVFDRTQVRLDAQRPLYDPNTVPTPNSNHLYSSYDIISTDVPGPAGYSSGPFHAATLDGTLREYGSYFSRFGGTSAASALIAGFLSLGKSTQDMGDGSGVAAKAWLLSKCYTIEYEDEAMIVPCWKGQPSFPDKSDQLELVIGQV